MGVDQHSGMPMFGHLEQHHHYDDLKEEEEEDDDEKKEEKKDAALDGDGVSNDRSSKMVQEEESGKQLSIQ